MSNPISPDEKNKSVDPKKGLQSYNSRPFLVYLSNPSVSHLRSTWHEDLACPSATTGRCGMIRNGELRQTLQPRSEYDVFVGVFVFVFSPPSDRSHSFDIIDRS